MKYRKFINENINISILGFGCMRFPLYDSNDNGSINKEKSFEMLKYAFDSGINYFDTAYTYHDGQSEVFMGEAIKKLGRDKLYLATKMPLWLCKEYSDYENIFEEQLEKLQTKYIDFYLAHSLGENSYRKMVENNIFDFFDKERKSGRMKYVGFSFHDNLELFKEVVDSYSWDFCQIQLNYMDENYQAGVEGLRYAKSKGLSVVVMEPVKGGFLANGPKEVKDYFKNLDKEYSMAQWALKWVYNFNEVSLALSGMSNLDQVKENIEIASKSEPNSLDLKELETINKVKEFFNSKTKIACTACEYCLPCPEGVQIPSIFSKYNNAIIYDKKDRYKKEYISLVEENKDASLCVECRQCESICPQSLNIIDTLKEANDYFIGCVESFL